jgi:hypothetical protein
VSGVPAKSRKLALCTPACTPDRFLIVLVYVVLDDRTSASSLLGDALEVFVRREDAARFVEEVRRDDPELAACLRIEERELEAGGLN